MEREESQSKFIADLMLGKLSRWLRVLGYDTNYRIKKDEQLLKKSKNRILLTKDKRLAKRSSNSVLIEHKKIENQLKQLKEDGLIELNLDPEDSLCPKCNGEIKTASESETDKFEHQVPKHIDKAWKCINCGQIYWEGKHWENMNEKINKINNRN